MDSHGTAESQIYNNDGGGIAFDDLKHDVQSNYSVSEPLTLLFLGMGLFGLAGIRRRFEK
jgi:hypothetical protein